MTKRESQAQGATLLQQAPRFLAPVVVILLLFTLSAVLKPFGAQGETRFSNLLEAAVACASGIVGMRSARALDRAERRTWQLFGLGAFAWGLGQGFAFVYELTTRTKPP